MAKAMGDVLKSNNVTPATLRSDSGSECIGKEMKKFLKDHQIRHIQTSYETKANYAERVIKSMKLNISLIRKIENGLTI